MILAVARRTIAWALVTPLGQELAATPPVRRRQEEML